MANWIFKPCLHGPITPPKLKNCQKKRMVWTIFPTLQKEGCNQCLNKIWDWGHARILFKLRILIIVLFIFHKNTLFIPISSMTIPTKTKTIFNNHKNGHNLYVATPLWDKCEDETHTPKSGKLESSGTPKNSELDCRGQISSHSSVLGVIGKVLKCRFPKWPRMSHLDICSSSYEQKKGRESNCQFDSWPLKVGNRPLPDIRL
jgi:hypothetical protein